MEFGMWDHNYTYFLIELEFNDFEVHKEFFLINLKIEFVFI
jgi:hypothetical protein